MEYFNLNAFFLGVLLFACLYISNLVYSLLCIFWKIKIVEFSLFFSPWFSLYNQKVLGTKFTLGWLPLGGHIKPFGMTTDDAEKNKVEPKDLQNAFFNKPKYLQTIFRSVPWIIYILALVISIIIINSSNLVAGISDLANYVVQAFQAMFSNNAGREQFILKTKEIIDGKNIVVFGFTLLLLLMLLFTPITTILNWFSNDENKKSNIQKVIGFIGTIFILWLMLWKIPKFVFSFFTFSQSLIYILSFFGGMFLVGLIFFFATLFVVKSISQNLNYNNLEKDAK